MQNIRMLDIFAHRKVYISIDQSLIMPIRTIILRVDENEFKAYEAHKEGKESWENMFKRVVLKKESGKK